VLAEATGAKRRKIGDRGAKTGDSAVVAEFILTICRAGKRVIRR
jgi:hypothetical protein